MSIKQSDEAQTNAKKSDNIPTSAMHTSTHVHIFVHHITQRKQTRLQA